MRAAVYARVSTVDQEPENQLPAHIAAERLGVSRSTVKRWRHQVQQSRSN
jgi:predicted site-specific integrase-resolvase